jgi:predicted MFS family arabinose efflux permease
MEGNTKLQSTYSTADLVGPGIGGLLVQLFGAALAILADALSYVVAAATLLTIRAAENEIAGSDRTPERMRSEVVAGVRWVLREPVLRSQLIGLTAGGFGLFMVIPIIYVYAYGSLHFSPGLLGALFVLHGAAGLVGLLMSRAVVDRIGLGKTMWLSQLGIAGGVLALPLASFGAAIAVFAAGFTVNGIAEMIQDVNQVTLRQSLTPPSLQGRMNATFRLCYWGAWPVASLLGGALASWLGAADTILAGGSLGLAAAALIAFSPLGRLRLASPLGAEVPAPSDGGGT